MFPAQDTKGVSPKQLLPVNDSGLYKYTFDFQNDNPNIASNYKSFRRDFYFNLQKNYNGNEELVFNIPAKKHELTQKSTITPSVKCLLCYNIANSYNENQILDFIARTPAINFLALDEYDQTPLLWAVSKGYKTVVKIILEKTRGQSIYISTKHKNTSTREKMHKNLSTQEKNLNKLVKYINVPDRFGQSIVTIALWSLQLDIANLLLNEADIDIGTSLDVAGETELMHAVWLQKPDLVKKILHLSNGKKVLLQDQLIPYVNVSDLYNTTALCFASWRHTSLDKLNILHAFFKKDEDNNFIYKDVIVFDESSRNNPLLFIIKGRVEIQNLKPDIKTREVLTFFADNKQQLLDSNFSIFKLFIEKYEAHDMPTSGLTKHRHYEPAHIINAPSVIQGKQSTPILYALQNLHDPHDPIIQYLRTFRTSKHTDTYKKGDLVLNAEHKNALRD